MPNKVIVTTSKLDELANSVAIRFGSSTPLTIAQMKTLIDTSYTWETMFDSTSTIVADNPNYIAINNFTDTIGENEVWRVTWNGTTYTFTSVYEPNVIQTYYIGNMGVVDSQYDDGSGATFLFYKRTSSQLVAVTSDNAGVITLKLERQTTATPATVNLQSKTVTPTKSAQTVTADSGYDGLSSVGVEAIPAQYITTTDANATAADILASKTAYVNGAKITGTMTKIFNPTSAVSYNSTARRIVLTEGYYAANSSVEIADLGLIPEDEAGTQPSLQSKSVTPNESQQTVTADSGYDGLSSVAVGAISSTYIGSGITQQAGSTVTPSTSSQTVATSGKYMTGDITVNPIPSNYIDTTDADATASHLAIGKTAYVNGQKISGTLGVLFVSNVTYNPTARRVVIPAGYYTSNNVGVMISDLGLIPEDEAGTDTTDATAVAADILSGKTAYVNGSKLTGTLEVHNYYTGSSDPSSSLGSNGDLYLKVSS